MDKGGIYFIDEDNLVKKVSIVRGIRRLFTRRIPEYVGRTPWRRGVTAGVVGGEVVRHAIERRRRKKRGKAARGHIPRVQGIQIAYGVNSNGDLRKIKIKG